MTVKLLLSKPAGGKTSFCVSEIMRIRKENPMAPIKVIIPDKMQMAYWKKVLAEKSTGPGCGNGFIGTEIISFSKLAMGILDNTDRSPRLILSRLNSLCIKEAIRIAAEIQPFQYFSPIIDKPGVLIILEKSIRILQHACITPDKLEAFAKDDPKTADTARVYREYLGVLKDNNWVGAAGLLSAAVELLKKNPSSFSDSPLLIADGFDELTRDCINLLGVLSPFCDEILITLPADPNSDSPTDQRILKNAEKIHQQLNAEYIEPASYTQYSQILNLADRTIYPGMKPDNIHINLSGDAFLMIEASSRRTEVREALRELKRRMLSQKLSPADCAVFVPDMNSYAPILRQFGREMGIPLRFTQKQPLAQSPAASALKRLLHLAPDFETVKVLSVLRLPFFSGCPDPEDTNGENYFTDLFVVDQIGRKMNIINGIAEWDSAYARAISNAPESVKTQNDASEDLEASDEGKVYEFPPKDKMERIRKSFMDFSRILIPPEGKMSRANWIHWLENLLKTTHFFEQIEDRKERSFESDFRAMLKRIVFCEDKLGQEPISYANFLIELEVELESTVQSEQEYAADRVLVGDIGQTSGCRWKLIILTGFAEGTFPRAEHEDLILTNALRQKLDLPSDMDQQMIFRHAITRSDTSLIITRPTKTDKGEEWPASIYWRMLRELLDKTANLKDVSENTAVSAASLDEFAFRLASGRALNSGSVSEYLHVVLTNKLSTAANEFQRFKEQSEGHYSPDNSPALKAAISDPVKEPVPYSCSAIETWLTCPFKYFLMKKLKLEQPQEPGTGLDAAQLGTLYHTVLEYTFSPGTVYDSKEEALEKANKYFDRVFSSAPDSFFFHESELWQYEKEKYRQKLMDSIEKMYSSPTNMPVNSHWMSIGTEMKFGYPEEGKANAEPLTVDTEAGPIQIRGIIDRIDRNDGGLLRVVDYKTSLSSFKTEALAAGAHIQAGVYAAAVVHALHMGTKCEGMYWGINDKSVKGCIKYDAETDEAIPNIEFLNQFAAGIRDAAFKAEPAGGDCPDYCPGAGWCKKYVRRQKYG